MRSAAAAVGEPGDPGACAGTVPEMGGRQSGSSCRRSRGLLPRRIDTYFEPFLGGAALFFRLASLGSFKRAVLADANAELVNCYQAIRDRVGEVIEALQKYRNDRRRYYAVRAKVPASKVERAARLIYLNRCGYNGLYRVNSKGEFNVPFGRYRRPVICDVRKLSAASAALQGVDDPGRRLRGDRRDRRPERLRLLRSPLRAALEDGVLHGVRRAPVRRAGARAPGESAPRPRQGRRAGAALQLVFPDHARALQRARLPPGPGAALDQLGRARSRSDRRAPGSQLPLPLREGAP